MFLLVTANEVHAAEGEHALTEETLEMFWLEDNVFLASLAALDLLVSTTSTKTDRIQETC